MFVIVCMPPFLKGEGLDEKEEVTFLRGGEGYKYKNKLQSEIFNGKKFDKKKCFSLSQY